jgi:hypothetical protein
MIIIVGPPLLGAPFGNQVARRPAVVAARARRGARPWPPAGANQLSAPGDNQRPRPKRRSCDKSGQLRAHLLSWPAELVAGPSARRPLDKTRPAGRLHRSHLCAGLAPGARRAGAGQFVRAGRRPNVSTSLGGPKAGARAPPSPSRRAADTVAGQWWASAQARTDQTWPGRESRHTSCIGLALVVVVQAAAAACVSSACRRLCALRMCECSQTYAGRPSG